MIQDTFPELKDKAPETKSVWNGTLHPLALWKCPKTKEDPKKSHERRKATWQKVLIEMKKAKIKTWSPEQTQMYNKGKYQDTCGGIEYSIQIRKREQRNREEGEVWRDLTLSLRI